MSQQQQGSQPKVYRFLNDYRKKLSLLKIKSFYANHLCKKNCLEKNLKGNNESCITECDGWLMRFFQFKEEKNPDKLEVIVYNSQEIPENERYEYEKNVANLKLTMKDYLAEVEGFIDSKLAEETKK